MKLKKIIEDCMTEDYEVVVTLMGDLTNDEQKLLLNNILHTNALPIMKEFLLNTICEQNHHQGVRIVAELLKDDEASVRSLATDTLKRYGVHAFEVLKNYLDSQDHDERLLAVQVVSDLSDTDILPLLRKLLQQEKEMNVLIAIIEGIGDVSTDKRDQQLIQAVIEKHNHPQLDFIGKRAMKRLASEREANGN